MTQNIKVVQDTRWDFQTFFRRRKFIKLFFSIIKLFAKNRNAKTIFLRIAAKNSNVDANTQPSRGFPSMMFKAFPGFSSSPTEVVTHERSHIKNTQHRRRNNIAVIFFGFFLTRACVYSFTCVYTKEKYVFFISP